MRAAVCLTIMCLGGVAAHRDESLVGHPRSTLQGYVLCCMTAKHAMALSLVGMVLKADPYAHTYGHTAVCPAVACVHVPC